jgi:AraC family transcriptional regulator, transcriptional activator of pobA
MNCGKEIPVYGLSSLVPTAKWGSFSVERFEDSFNAAKGDVYAPHRHDLYEVFWISKGEGVCCVDFQPYEIKPPMLVFVAPGQVHSWSLRGPFAGYIILFTNEFFATHTDEPATYPLDIPFAQTPGHGPALPVLREHSVDFSRLFRKLEAEFQASLLDQDAALHAYLRLLLIEAKRLAEKAPGITHKDESASLLTKKFLQLVERNFLAIASVADYAEMLNVTPNHLIETTKRTIGKPAGRIIRERLLLEAKRLLCYSSMSASEIAYHLSFEDPSYFSRFFKKYTGICPIEFRNTPNKDAAVSPVVPFVASSGTSHS